jgi:hypothetical protein
MLASDERKRVDGHLLSCADCAAELRQVRELNLLLVTLPPAPPVAFAPFWLKLQAVLPQRRPVRVPVLGSYHRVGLAFAIAGCAVLAIGATALAAPAAMPDSPIYPVKTLEESVQLALAPASAVLSVQLQQANERLREASTMASDHKPLLAAQSLRAFRVTLNDAAAALKRADPRIAAKEEDQLRAGLAAVEKENAAKNDDDVDVRNLVTSATADLDRIDPQAFEPPAATATPAPSAAPTPAPTPSPRPVLKTTPRPEPSEQDWRR